MQHQILEAKHNQMSGICQTISQKQEPVENVQKDEENESIGQFLSLDQVDQKKQENQQEVAQNSEQVPSPGSQYSSSEESVKPKAKRSPLHNFQKHFVTTLRRNVRIKWPESNQNYIVIAKEIWAIFKNSKKYTKEFVYVILGQNSLQIDLDVLKKYGLFKSYETYGAQDYLKAQAFLKEKVLQTFRQTPSQKIMYQRRIEKKKQFSSYFYKVLGEIEEGSMKKRLPKKRKLLKRHSGFKSLP